jgi:hypothetical protein
MKRTISNASIAEAISQVVKARGYLVSETRPFMIGHRHLGLILNAGEPCEQPFVIFAATNREDWLEQGRQIAALAGTESVDPDRNTASTIEL